MFLDLLIVWHTSYNNKYRPSPYQTASSLSDRLIYFIEGKKSMFAGSCSRLTMKVIILRLDGMWIVDAAIITII